MFVIITILHLYQKRSRKAIGIRSSWCQELCCFLIVTFTVSAGFISVIKAYSHLLQLCEVTTPGVVTFVTCLIQHYFCLIKRKLFYSCPSCAIITCEAERFHIVTSFFGVISVTP